ncbi:hypothetical protein EYF80_007508 [Liparis tanakae]|uniref:Uncharacterized protein n=1 Tax=Liparis tanakae TaxID=230148 RepID=A0A4Z2IW10_9TELE|nr:hypothetical protein EYF80_007508 [Liparis tanakae]
MRRGAALRVARGGSSSGSREKILQISSCVSLNTGVIFSVLNNVVSLLRSILTAASKGSSAGTQSTYETTASHWCVGDTRYFHWSPVFGRHATRLQTRTTSSRRPPEHVANRGGWSWKLKTVRGANIAAAADYKPSRASAPRSSSAANPSAEPERLQRYNTFAFGRRSLLRSNFSGGFNDMTFVQAAGSGPPSHFQEHFLSAGGPGGNPASKAIRRGTATQPRMGFDIKHTSALHITTDTKAQRWRLAPSDVQLVDHTGG